MVWSDENGGLKKEAIAGEEKENSTGCGKGEKGTGSREGFEVT